MEKLTFKEVHKLSFEQMLVYVPKVRDHGTRKEKDIASLACLKNFTPEQIKILQDLSNINCKDCEGCFFCVNCVDCKDCEDCRNCEGCWLSVHLESCMYYGDNKPNALTNYIGNKPNKPNIDIVHQLQYLTHNLKEDRLQLRNHLILFLISSLLTLAFCIMSLIKKTI